MDFADLEVSVLVLMNPYSFQTVKLIIVQVFISISLKTFMHLLLLYVHFYHATTLLAGKGVDKLV
jgi:hypothetical protein